MNRLQYGVGFCFLTEAKSIGPHDHTAYIWPVLASDLFRATLGICSRHHCGVSGRVLCTNILLPGVLWSFGTALELATLDLQTKFLRVNFQAFRKKPLAKQQFCISRQFPYLAPLLTRLKLASLHFLPPLASVVRLALESMQRPWHRFRLQAGHIHLCLANVGRFLGSYRSFLPHAVRVGPFQLFIQLPQQCSQIVPSSSQALVSDSASLLRLAAWYASASMVPTPLI